MIDIHRNHQRCYSCRCNTEQHGESQQSSLCRVVNVLVVDFHGQHGLWMKYSPEFVANHLERHESSETFVSAAGATGTSADKHENSQDDPRQMWPTGNIVAIESCCRRERNNLKQRASERMKEPVAITPDEYCRQPNNCSRYHEEVESELGVLEKPLRFSLENENTEIEQGETCSREEHEKHRNRFQRGRIEEPDGVVMC